MDQRRAQVGREGSAATLTPVPSRTALKHGSYNRVAGVYDLLGALYSQGAMKRAKRAHLQHLEPGERVLYAGAGTGVECLDAAQKGAHVTVVDSSPHMLELCRERFARARVAATFLLEDARALRPESRWDMVVAPFFLNVFSEEEVPLAMRALVEQVRSRGRFVTVDFRAPSARRSERLLQKVHYLPPLALFSLLTNNPWHPLYDYEEIARRAKLPLSLRHRSWTRAFGLRLYETLVWEVP